MKVWDSKGNEYSLNWGGELKKKDAPATKSGKARQKPDKDRKNRVSSNKERYAGWLIAQKCVLCGFSNHHALVPHHLIPDNKESNISDMIQKGLPYEAIEEELSKCVILCQNCHWLVHHKKLRL